MSTIQIQATKRAIKNPLQAGRKSWIAKINVKGKNIKGDYRAVIEREFLSRPKSDYSRYYIANVQAGDQLEMAGDTLSLSGNTWTRTINRHYYYVLSSAPNGLILVELGETPVETEHLDAYLEAHCDATPVECEPVAVNEVPF
jgi:hypothetical protein